MVSRHLIWPQPRGARLQGAIAFSKGLLATLILGALARTAWAWQEPVVYQVRRSDFAQDVTGRGTIESARTVEVRCEVPSQDSGGTTILRIVPEGAEVKAGDMLVELDASALKDEQIRQQIVSAMSEAAIVDARSRRDIAVLAKQEYLEGLYRLEAKSIENEILLAEASLRRAQEAVEQSQALAEKGYATRQQSEADEFRLRKARNDLELAELRLMVLEKYTKPKMAKQLELEVKTLEAKLNAAEQTHRINLDRLARVKSHVEKCTIKAPVAGHVVYANVRGARQGSAGIIKEGARVRQRQVVLRLVDPKRMQVKVNVRQVGAVQAKKGAPATIVVDAFPDQPLKGAVEKITEYPLPASRSKAGGRIYQAIVRIHQPPPGLRAGMTAEVKIRVEQQPDVLQVPVQAVIQHGQKHYCLLHKDGAFEAREVTIGPTNDKSVVIRRGLQEGDQVVPGAAEYRDRVDLPKLSSKPK